MKKQLLLALLILMVPALTHAQNVHDINIMHFKMSSDPYGLITQDSTYRLDHLKWYVGGMFSYANDPLVLYVNGDKEGSIVKHQLLMDLTFSIGIWKYFQLGAHIQAALYQAGDDSTDMGLSTGDLKAFAFSDVKLIPKVLILDRTKHAVGLAFVPAFTLPTASNRANTGDPSAIFEPRIIVDKVVGKNILIVANAGYRLRKATQVGDLMVDDEIFLSVGTEIPIKNRISFVGEVYGSIGLKDSDTDSDSSIDKQEVPVEAVFGARWRHKSGLILTGGFGSGLVGGYGAPRLRVFVAAGFAPDLEKPAEDPDRDKDGIPDKLDKCPDDPEDKNGFEDEDGCPDGDKDTDKDGIVDMKDKCPKEPEDKNGFEDEDGCPDGAKDTDKDGIPDNKDKCPKDPEDKNGFEDEDGCPDGAKDTDKDGIPDYKDKCPTEPEDKDNFEDEDGCPDADNDGDGFCDPWVAEKGLEKKYASVCKGTDKCPNEKETINGVEDEDGCPDKGKESAVITKTSIVIMDKVYFDTAKATLQRRSYKILDVVIKVLKTHTHISGIEIQGHTDDDGPDDENQKLSEARANTVLKYFIKKGIDAKRLTAKGYGEAQPMEDCTGKKGRPLRKCREKNRRVEFKIVNPGKGDKK
ncbi:OmpA family protein [Myxococcota bacterium]|nr:OmpA family protein [Myxococcota bacterium]MBU1381791.1 OmpA family protein [Myxococcota bacterium]MBU1496021.1 OmpA family protein [Myxococcota bacterium]